MIPQIPSKGGGKGASFKGAVTYYLHDKGAQTHDRVAWTHTLNLATDNPDTAWKVMAATAMNRDALKAASGQVASGRKSARVVYHFSLSWHPDEAAGLDQAEMIAAARSALSALGADDRQALIVAHRDTAHPHVHLVVNRVHPDTGLMWDDKNSKRKLRDWASEYERGRGLVFCHDREAKRAVREAEQTRGSDRYGYSGDTHKPRALIEAQRAAIANDNTTKAQELAADYRAKAAALAAKTRALRESHAQAWRALAERHAQRMADIRDTARSHLERARADVRRRFQPDCDALKKHQAAERTLFEAREANLVGRTRNAFNAGMQRLGAQLFEGRRPLDTLKDAYQILADPAARRQAFEDAQARAISALNRRQKAALGPEFAVVREEARAAKTLSRASYGAEHAALVDSQAREAAAVAQEWALHRVDRITAWNALPASLTQQRTFSDARARDPAIEDKVARLKDRVRRRQQGRDRDSEQEQDWDD